MGKDTIANWEVKSYGTGFEGSFKIISKGKVSIEESNFGVMINY